ncbi:hypothetical protein [Capnocytophaga gingivalis]|uniref:hypothetical protein n=1 Tax=Capnocytophaga gingivalis TaxID=1017 RepID=UPI0028EA8DD8|nr:hypothetical protein [Capnocytophaga gingivalis]
MELSFIHNFLINEGFILTKTKELNNNVSNYRKEQDASIFRIGFIIKEEDEKNLFWGFSIYINFLSIENILVPILAKNNLVGRESSPKDIYNSFFVDSDFKIPTIKKEIKSDNDIKQIEDDFYLFFNTDALPFFEKWKDLNVLYEYIKDKTEEELWDILGQFAPMKKAVILKLCNDSNYQEFMDSYFQKQKEYFDEDPEDIDNIRYYNASKELKEILDNTEPIYNV